MKVSPRDFEKRNLHMHKFWTSNVQWTTKKSAQDFLKRKKMKKEKRRKTRKRKKKKKTPSQEPVNQSRWVNLTPETTSSINICNRVTTKIPQCSDCFVLQRRKKKQSFCHEGKRSNVTLTACYMQWTCLSIHGELFQVHGTVGFYCQSGRKKWQDYSYKNNNNLFVKLM